MGHPERGQFLRLVGYKLAILAIFQPIKHRISETVQDRTKVCYWSLIGNHIPAFDWYQNQRPWMTLNWPWTAIMRSVTLHTCFSEPTTKIWTKVDPYHPGQKCSPGITVSSEIKFMRIFTGVRWRGGFKWEWCCRKLRFSLISPAISSEPLHLRPQLLYCAMYCLSGSSATPKQMTLNDLEWPFCVKISFGLGN